MRARGKWATVLPSFLNHWGTDHTWSVQSRPAGPETFREYDATSTKSPAPNGCHRARMGWGREARRREPALHLGPSSVITSLRTQSRERGSWWADGGASRRRSWDSRILSNWGGGKMGPLIQLMIRPAEGEPHRRSKQKESRG